MSKPPSTELGNISPVIIVPGYWSTRQFGYQAAHVATMLVNNAGFNCVAPRVVVTHRDWLQRREFLEALKKMLASLPTRRAYYPGAFTCRAIFQAAHPSAHHVGSSSQGEMSWTLIRDVNLEERDDVCFRGGVLCADE